MRAGRSSDASFDREITYWLHPAPGRGCGQDMLICRSAFQQSQKQMARRETLHDGVITGKVFTPSTQAGDYPALLGLACDRRRKRGSWSDLCVRASQKDKATAHRLALRGSSCSRYDASLIHDSHPTPFLQPKPPGYLVRLGGRGWASTAEDNDGRSNVQGHFGLRVS